MYTCVSLTCTVEPLIKDTLNKGHLCIKTLSNAPTYIVAIHFTSERGQPLYNGQNDPVSVIQRFHCIYIVPYMIHYVPLEVVLV